jgi:hypothetical protein
MIKHQNGKYNYNKTITSQNPLVLIPENKQSVHILFPHIRRQILLHNIRPNSVS